MAHIDVDPNLDHDLHSWYLSWENNGTTIGAAIITVERPKNTYIHAIRAALVLGIRPEGKLDGWPIMRKIDTAFTNRLLTPHEAGAIDAYLAAENCRFPA